MVINQGITRTVVYYTMECIGEEKLVLIDESHDRSRFVRRLPLPRRLGWRAGSAKSD